MTYRWTALLVGLLAVGCYNPNVAYSPDGMMGFQCYLSDDKPCPDGYACSATSMDVSGWCVPQGSGNNPPPSAISVWDFGKKTMAAKATVYEGTCPRTKEPNDTTAQAVNLPPPQPPLLGFDICPDAKAPQVPDVDVFKFQIEATSRVYIYASFLASQGDLDVALYQDNGTSAPMFLQNDGLGVGDDSCQYKDGLAIGTTYYAVVRGAPSVAGDYNAAGVKYAQNNYKITIAAIPTGSVTPPPCTPAM